MNARVDGFSEYTGELIPFFSFIHAVLSHMTLSHVILPNWLVLVPGNKLNDTKLARLQLTQRNWLNQYALRVGPF